MTTSSAPPNAWLNDWVHRDHTAPVAVERYRSLFGGDALHLLVIPDFFAPDVAGRIAGFLDTEAEFTRRYALTATGPHDASDDDDHHEQLVSEAEWLAAPPESRFLRFGVGPGQPTRLSVGWMRYLAFRAALVDRRFASYVESLTGLALGPVSSLSAHAMGAGDMLAPHNDTNRQRQLAFICYFSRDWQLSHGGTLVITGLDGAITRVAPAFNTLVLFEVTAHKSHRVEPIAEMAGTARRLSLSGWFDHPLPGV